MNKKPFIAAVVGPTASGKTAVSIALAKRLNGEILSCDSMQVYQGLEIGTAKPSEEEIREVPHHLIGEVPVTQDFSLSDYVACAERAANEICARGRLPLLVGGTGLYARSFLQGTVFEDNSRDDALRKCLTEQAEQNGTKALYQKLLEADPVSAGKIHPNNVKRLVRALEYFMLTGSPISNQEVQTQSREAPYDYLMLCLDFRDRQVLYRRINARVEQMMRQGLLSEAEVFYNQTRRLDKLPTAAQAIGYKELFPYLEGALSLEKAVENLKQATRNYAKRQLTWFRREKEITCLYVDAYKDIAALTDAAAVLIENRKK